MTGYGILRVVWYGIVRVVSYVLYGTCGMPWHSITWYDVYGLWYGIVFCGMVWYDMAWYGRVLCGMLWYDMVWYGTA